MKHLEGVSFTPIVMHHTSLRIYVPLTQRIIQLFHHSPLTILSHHKVPSNVAPSHTITGSIVVQISQPPLFKYMADYV